MSEILASAGHNHVKTVGVCTELQCQMYQILAVLHIVSERCLYLAFQTLCKVPRQEYISDKRM